MGGNASRHAIIFEGILQAYDVPPKEKTIGALKDMSVLLTGAGFETTGNALSVAHLHVSSNPTIHAKLTEELVTNIPNPQSQLSWQTLEKLPYLKAVLQEAVRMSIVVMARQSRINRRDVMRYEDYVIPPGTIVSMSHPFILYNADVYPEPHTFNPDRWLCGDEKATKNLVAFSRGSRSCIGIQ